MAASAQKQMFFANKVADALLAYLIKSYTETSSRVLGRTMQIKVCYFDKASGVPLPFRIEIYHYGPFSQEIFYRTDDLLLDGVIEDRSSDPAQSNFVPGSNLDPLLDFFGEAIKQHEANLKRVAIMFSRLDPSQMELVSTIHYIHSSHSEWFKEVPSKDAVVTSVVQIKGDKFTSQIVEKAYDILRDASLLH